MEMLQLNDLHKTFNPGTVNEKVALNGLSLKLNEGDFVTVIGGNGAGKSTLLKIIVGELTPDTGEVITAKGKSLGYLAVSYTHLTLPTT